MAKKPVDIEDLIILNEMIKKNNKKNNLRAFLDSQDIVDDDDDHHKEETLLEKGFQAEKIVAVTTLDNLDMLICYLIKYKKRDQEQEPELELVPNTIAHKYCPQMVIDFLESKLTFSTNQDTCLSQDILFESEHQEFEKDKTTDPETQQQQQNNNVEDDENIYVLDELADCFQMKHLKEMLEQTTGSTNYQETFDEDLENVSSQILKIPETSREISYQEKDQENDTSQIELIKDEPEEIAEQEPEMNVPIQEEEVPEDGSDYSELFAKKDFDELNETLSQSQILIKTSSSPVKSKPNPNSNEYEFSESFSSNEIEELFSKIHHQQQKQKSKESQSESSSSKKKKKKF